MLTDVRSEGLIRSVALTDRPTFGELTSTIDGGLGENPSTTTLTMDDFLLHQHIHATSKRRGGVGVGPT